MAHEKPTKVIAGVRPPSDTPLTENEWKWIEILRIICNDKVGSVAQDMLQTAQSGTGCRTTIQS